MPGFCSPSSSCTRVDDQNIVVWGCGEEGQLGIANLEKYKYQKHCLPNTRDALHTKTVRVLTPQVLPMLSKQFVRQVACGYSHSGALTEDGRVYTWGADAGGLETGFPMLGYGIPAEFTQANKSVTQSHTPQIVKSLESKFVMSLQCGGFHTACVDDAGEIFTWGLNDRGQLGHGDNLSRSQPEVVEALQGRNVVEVACGHIHTLALQSNRETFSWGANGAGQLGHGSKDDILSPRTIKALLGDAVMVICAGPFHSAAINKICSVFTWGAGEWGRLGHGEAVDCTAPRLVEDLERKGIRSMSLGLYHTMALADNGDVYTWGRGDDGQLGHEDKTRMELKPRMVESLEGMEIRQVHCGYYHSYAMNADVFERPVARI